MRLLSLILTLVLLLAVVSGEGEDKSDDASVELTLPLSCREVIFKEARDPVSCAMVRCSTWFKVANILGYQVPQSALVYDEEEEEDGWEIPNPRSHDDEPTEPEPEISETFVWSPGTQVRQALIVGKDSSGNVFCRCGSRHRLGTPTSTTCQEVAGVEAYVNDTPETG